MPDLLVKDVDARVLRDFGNEARRRGISNEDFIRLQLSKSAEKYHSRKATLEDWQEAAYLCRDLLDPDFVKAMDEM